MVKRLIKGKRQGWHVGSFEVKAISKAGERKWVLSPFVLFFFPPPVGPTESKQLPEDERTLLRPSLAPHALQRSTAGQNTLVIIFPFALIEHLRWQHRNQKHPPYALIKC